MTQRIYATVVVRKVGDGVYRWYVVMPDGEYILCISEEVARERALSVNKEINEGFKIGGYKG